MSSFTRAPGYTDDLVIFNLANIVVCSVLGITINSLVLIVLLKKLRKGGAHDDIKICTFIAVTDFLVSVGLMIRAIFSNVPYNIFGVHPYWCKFDLLTTGQLVMYSGYSLAVMSVERFLLICFNIKLSIYIWFGLILGTWTPQFVIVVISAVGYNLQYFTKLETSCSLNAAKPAYYSYIYATALFFLSYFLVVFCYISIMVKKLKQCLNQINLNIPKDKVYSELRSTFAKSIVNIVLYILVYAGKLYTACYELYTGLKRTLLMDFASQNLIQYCCVVNSVILIWMNTEVREGFFELLNSIKSSLRR
ncbi:family A G protein-coupled receptor-like protein [Conidiobolus coronatus NRRL 28638]|uniref:Family A G protein-coupled receptor-like protein n=1 Tax=Conidiobolus coronatus (strain ATCC 28846 / CBS 209.66 / NRRL 28638) TaxID=796925 RepID=A0A137NSL7_CONC2|nr:family A G protein-coupled receptor-like protein [Conidiobolus coronatus NRRL 28638]|eukprot:KXN65696.1 family A G protein-coupled receptor-like protein [Conidiobolus coronatus NRRL 28638]